jgi:acyl carrier protein
MDEPLSSKICDKCRAGNAACYEGGRKRPNGSKKPNSIEEQNTAEAVSESKRIMTEATDPCRGTQYLIPASHGTLTSNDDARLSDALKRCSASTREAAFAYRRTGSLDHLPAIIHGLVEHYVERSMRAKLKGSDDGLRLVEDLAIDSLTMLEIVFLAEDVLQIKIDNEELRPFRTIGDIKRFISARMAPAPH